jgi:hypothetical protein
MISIRSSISGITKTDAKEARAPRGLIERRDSNEAVDAGFSRKKAVAFSPEN